MFDDNAKTCFNVVFFYSSSLDFFLALRLDLSESI